jgi:hypothetical protein
MSGGDISGALLDHAEERLDLLKQIALKGYVNVHNTHELDLLNTAIIHLKEIKDGKPIYTPVEPMMLGVIQDYLEQRGNTEQSIGTNDTKESHTYT